MIKTTGQLREVLCDDCGASGGPEVDQADFEDAISTARSEGFSIKPDGRGGWEHLCSDCRPDGIAAQRRKFGR